VSQGRHGQSSDAVTGCVTVEEGKGWRVYLLHFDLPLGEVPR